MDDRFHPRLIYFIVIYELMVVNFNIQNRDLFEKKKHTIVNRLRLLYQIRLFFFVLFFNGDDIFTDVRR